jgi:hypothetical protein
VLAVAVNSPLLFGQRLWQETRVALFQHSTDERSRPQLARNQPTRQLRRLLAATFRHRTLSRSNHSLSPNHDHATG